MGVRPYTLIRADRKTIALVIGSNGELQVRAPITATVDEIEACIVRKDYWIREKTAKVSTFDVKHATLDMKDGETVIFLGDDYIIDYSDNDEISFDGRRILVPKRANSRELLLTWFKQEAYKIITERVELFSKRIGSTYGTINVTEAKARWGSCSANGNLNFAWRLVMCPISVIDYVVVHEMSHLAFKSHSQEFWMRVKTILPNYHEQQEWMAINRKLMEIL